MKFRLALVLVFCALPLRAGGLAAPASPVVPILIAAQAFPPFCEQLVAQTAVLEITHRLPDLPSPDGDPLRLEAVRAVRLLAAHPELTALHREELKKTLGEPAAEVLEAAGFAARQEAARRPKSRLARELETIRDEALHGPSAPRSLQDLHAIFDGVRRAPGQDAFLSNLTMEEGSAATYMNLGRAYENGDGATRDGVQAYRWYALAALEGEPLARERLKAAHRSLPPRARAEGRDLFLGAVLAKGLLRNSTPPPLAFRAAGVFSPLFLVKALGRFLRPKVYLAGPWGFMDFNAARASYGRLAGAAREAAQPGLELLKRIGQELRSAGLSTLSPWTQTVPAQWIAGVMFGAGTDAVYRPWSDGSLAAGTLPKERLAHWTRVVGRDYRVSPEEYDLPPYEQAHPGRLEEIYRNMVGDAIYRGNKRHIESADIIFANLNAYRGDVDDGTLWEFIRAVELGKEAVVLVDREPESSLGEGIFGRENPWNMMLSGYVKEHRDRIRVFHQLDEALDYLKRRGGRL